MFLGMYLKTFVFRLIGKSKLYLGMGVWVTGVRLCNDQMSHIFWHLTNKQGALRGIWQKPMQYLQYHRAPLGAAPNAGIFIFSHLAIVSTAKVSHARRVTFTGCIDLYFYLIRTARLFFDSQYGLYCMDGQVCWGWQKWKVRLLFYTIYGWGLLKTHQYDVKYDFSRIGQWYSEGDQMVSMYGAR